MATMTNEGIEAIARFINGVSPVAAFTQIAIGSGSTPEAEGHTALASENTLYGSARAAATCSFTSPGTSTWNKTFSFSGPVVVREFGIFNASSAGNMFMRHVFTANKNYVDGQALEITVTHTAVRSS